MFQKFRFFYFLPLMVAISACGPQTTKTEIKDSAAYATIEVQDAERGLMAAGVRFTQVTYTEDDGVTPATAFILDESTYANQYVDAADHEGLIAVYIEALQRAIANPAVSASQKEVFSEKLEAALDYENMIWIGVSW